MCLQAIKGFTLVEMLVAVTIVATLSSVATLVYTHQLARAQRADAQAGLLQAAAELEHCYARRASYRHCTISQRSPNGSATISVATPAPQVGGFELSASLTSTSTRSAPCAAEMTLNALGERRPEACW